MRGCAPVRVVVFCVRNESGTWHQLLRCGHAVVVERAWQKDSRGEDRYMLSLGVRRRRCRECLARRPRPFIRPDEASKIDEAEFQPSLPFGEAIE